MLASDLTNPGNQNRVACEDLTATKGAVSLSVRRKRLHLLEAPDMPALVLVHGSSLASLPTFDLTVPGKPEYSMMDWFAARGFDVWTFDHEGYGRSTLTDGSSDVRCGVEDLEAVTSLVRTITGRSRFLMYGLSSGALRAAAFAAARPDRVERLVLDGFVWTGEGSPTLGKRREGAEYYKTHPRREIDRAFIASIFTRDHEGTSEREVIDACASAQLAYGNSVPTGTYLDMTSRLPIVDPREIAAPTAIVRGEHDGIATMDDLLAFFTRLPNPDKQFSVLPGLAHCTPLGVERRRLWRTVEVFLSAAAST